VFGFWRAGPRPADRARAGRQPVEPGKPKGEEVAALGARHGVHLVDDDRAQIREHVGRAVLGEQERQAFRRGQQDIGRHIALALAVVLRRVAGAGLDADGKAQILHRLREVAGDVGRERLERADIEGVDAGQGRILGL
jgi:hypothetical protein